MTRRFDVSYGPYGRHISKLIHILMFLDVSECQGDGGPSSAMN